jgi:hypothetical protein
MEKLEDKLVNMASEQIMPVRTNKTIAFVITIVGLVLFILAFVGLTDISAVKIGLIVTGIGVLTFGVVDISKAFHSEYKHFVYEPSGKKLKKYHAYVSHNDLPKIGRYLQENCFESLKNIQKEASSNKYLEIMATDDAAIVLAQTFEYIPYNYEPTSEIFILKGDAARLVLEFCKV